MMKPRHVPIRTCVACRSTDAKRGLLRVVRLADGTACYDPKGKMSGRGAYVCAKPDCIALARKQKKLERSLKIVSISETVFSELGVQAESASHLEARSQSLPAESRPGDPTPASSGSPETMDDTLTN